MFNTSREKILDQAILRINSYDKAIKEGISVNELSSCDMCFKVNGICYNCPFGESLNKNNYPHCNLTISGYHGVSSGIRANIGATKKERREHQRILIKRTKEWCKKHYPEYTIVRC